MGKATMRGVARSRMHASIATGETAFKCRCMARTATAQSDCGKVGRGRAACVGKKEVC
jgi:hypothetical protein